MKCQPVVYFSARHVLSPAAWRVIKSLSRHVVIVGRSNDPETAYHMIHDCDVFLVYLYADVCQNLFLLYEIGVAFVLRKPIVVIREADLKFSEISIAEHFRETRILMETGKSGPFQTCVVFGKACNLPLTLGDVFVYGYENSMVFSPSTQTKCIALLIDRVFSLSRELSISRKASNSAVKRMIQNNKLTESPVDITPVMNICDQSRIPHDDRKDAELPAKNRFEPVNEHVNPVISELREDEDDRLDSSDSSSSYDVMYLNDKTFITSANTSPLPSPIPRGGVYYPTPLPVYPMELCFPPLQIEKLNFDKHALRIAKADRLPSIVRRRVMKKEL